MYTPPAQVSILARVAYRCDRTIQHDYAIAAPAHPDTVVKLTIAHNHPRDFWSVSVFHRSGSILTHVRTRGEAFTAARRSLAQMFDLLHPAA